MNQPLIRLSVCFGDIPGKQFLNVGYPFDGTPEGFDTAFELCRVAYHEAARERVRPCGFLGPWATTAGLSPVSKANELVLVGDLGDPQAAYDDLVEYTIVLERVSDAAHDVVTWHENWGLFDPDDKEWVATRNALAAALEVLDKGGT